MYLFIYLFRSHVVGTELNLLLRSESQSITSLSIWIETKLGCLYYFQNLLCLVIDIWSSLQLLN